jgi:hypothetical protein
MELSLWAHDGGKTLLSLQLSCPNKVASVNSVDATKLWANAKNTQRRSFSPSSLRPDLTTSQSRGTGDTTPDSLNTFPVYFFLLGKTSRSSSCRWQRQPTSILKRLITSKMYVIPSYELSRSWLVSHDCLNITDNLAD